jgi:hypothetical protein
VAVHKRGLDPAKLARPIKPLGRVLVTIDDLAALVDLVGSRDGKSLPVSIEFPGGSIDKPEDLRALSNTEMESISVKTSEVEIILSVDSAEGIGDPDVVELVYTRWARTRQLKKEFRPREGPVILALVCLILILVISVWIERAALPVNIPPPTVLVIGFTFGALALFTIVVRRLYAARFARIYPGTLDEYRKDESSGKRQVVTWLIAILAVAISAIGVLLGILIKK